jgi:hypothetical protein
MAASALTRRKGNLRTVTDISAADIMLNPLQIEARRRQDQIKRNWDAYNGWFPDSIQRKPGKNQPNFSLKVGLIKAPIRKQNAFLFGQDVEIEVKPVVKKKPPTPTPTPDPMMAQVSHGLSD